jgi:hypothetical protein
MVMRAALGDAKKLGDEGPAIYKKIVAGGMFGGPKAGAPSPKGRGESPKFDLGLEEKVRWNCANGDPVSATIPFYPMFPES